MIRWLSTITIGTCGRETILPILARHALDDDLRLFHVRPGKGLPDPMSHLPFAHVPIHTTADDTR